MNFNEKVWEMCKLIPSGKVSTYKEIGKKIGKGQVYRAVGNALKRNPNAPKVPCHRVVCSDGSLGGYCGEMESRKKIKLLENEGIELFIVGKGKKKKIKIKDFEKKLWKF